MIKNHHDKFVLSGMYLSLPTVQLFVKLPALDTRRGIVENLEPNTCNIDHHTQKQSFVLTVDTTMFKRRSCQTKFRNIHKHEHLRDKVRKHVHHEEK